MLARLMSRVNGMKLPTKRSRLPLPLVRIVTDDACLRPFDGRGSHIAPFAFYVRVLEAENNNFFSAADFHLNSIRSFRRLALGRSYTSLEVPVSLVFAYFTSSPASR